MLRAGTDRRCSFLPLEMNSRRHALHELAARRARSSMHVRYLTRARVRLHICEWPFTYSDAFRKVISHVGSFTNIRGAHNLQYLVRTTERKPLTVFLQSGSHDFGE